jgi:hypothetical protein
MANSGPLAPLGLAVLFMTAAVIAVPYLRRRGDALTAWNLFLLGGAIFIGIGSLEVVYGEFHWPELQWFQPRTRDVQLYLVGVVVFYATILISYFWLKLPHKFTSRFLNKWPELRASLLFPLLVLLLLLSVAALFVKGVVFRCCPISRTRQYCFRPYLVSVTGIEIVAIPCYLFCSPACSSTLACIR